RERGPRLAFNPDQTMLHDDELAARGSRTAEALGRPAPHAAGRPLRAVASLAIGAFLRGVGRNDQIVAVPRRWRDAQGGRAAGRADEAVVARERPADLPLVDPVAGVGRGAR